MPRMNLGLLFSGCNQPGCPQRTNLLQCGACRGVNYCGDEHQRADRPQHKTCCEIVKKVLADLQTAESALRETEEDTPAMPGRPFENAVGSFWLWKATRPYMRARFDVMMALLNIRTGEAVRAALGHALDMLRLCHADNLGVRNYVAAMYLRLGRDQEAFDFLKWYTLKDNGGGQNGEDFMSSYSSFKGKDALEAVSLDAQPSSLSMRVAMVLIKTRLFLDMEKLRSAMAAKGRRGMSSEEKLAFLKEEAMSNILLARPDVLSMEGYQELIQDLTMQTHLAFISVKTRNPHFWPALLNPAPYANVPVTAYGLGSKEEVTPALRESLYAWTENFEALDLIRQLTQEDIKIDAVDAE
jgi:hypothetical protein